VLAADKDLVGSVFEAIDNEDKGLKKMNKEACHYLADA
jgi:hypothetical protein